MPLNHKTDRTAPTKQSCFLLYTLSPIPFWVGGILGGKSFGEGESESFGNAFAVCRVGTVAVADMSLFDKEFRIAHRACSVLTSRSLILRRHQSPQLARLCVIVAIEFALVVVIDLTRNRGPIRTGASRGCYCTSKMAGEAGANGIKKRLVVLCIINLGQPTLLYLKYHLLLICLTYSKFNKLIKKFIEKYIFIYWASY